MSLSILKLQTRSNMFNRKAKRHTQIKCQQEDSEMAQWVTPEDLSSPDHRVVP